MANCNSIRSFVAWVSLAAVFQWRGSTAAVLNERIVCNADNLLRNLRATTHTAAASAYCSGYLCLPTSLPPNGATTSQSDVATVTTYAHPLYLYNLQYYEQTETPLTYGSPPSPSTVPGGAACFDWEGPGCDYVTGAPACPTYTTPSWLSTTYVPAQYSSACSCLLSSTTSSTPAPTVSPTTTCTYVASGYPRTTIPAFCNPSFLTNAPSFKSTGVPTATATATVSAVQDKMDCCAACVDIFNCVAWEFVPGTTFTPNGNFPGGFDPWAAGSCKVVYYTGPLAGGGAPAVCPNGRLGELLDGSNNVPSGPYSYLFSNLYYNGWNEGPCGNPNDEFESATDPGVPDYDTLCPGSPE